MNITQQFSKQLGKQLSNNLEHLNATLEQVLTLVFTEMGDSHLPETAHRYSDINTHEAPHKTQNALETPQSSGPLAH